MQRMQTIVRHLVVARPIAMQQVSRARNKWVAALQRSSRTVPLSHFGCFVSMMECVPS
jgi:hypothetical protein